ncbi:MAG: MoxR family ATPase [Acidimicrobiia bacterium]|nr:MoxR family ATPase [Acidimicrobiia bacterium]
MTSTGGGPVATDAGWILDELEKVIVGKRDVLEMLLLTLLADGHVLIEDYPGLGKTLMARAFAQVTALDFSRAQFTPDLMPMDITGSTVLDQRDDLVFRAGPIFTNLLLADEINRAPAKTQAALLEAMEERQVTNDGTTRRLPKPFLVIATQNPIEYEGTYPLPEAQLDRFLARIRVGYPEGDDEWQVISRRLQRRTDDVSLDLVVDSNRLRQMQATAEDVHVGASVGHYMVEIARATRRHSSVYVGASPRGSLAMMKLARAHALLNARDFVIPDDVKHVAIPALAHRLVLRPELWVQEIKSDDIVAECVETVPAPAAPTRSTPGL